ncbi:hypothetical protein B566_EDAN012337 [Ephemera danica]|nr:hypothetical protein B566_EDAN012337 [Ephemera danica]
MANFTRAVATCNNAGVSIAIAHNEDKLSCLREALTKSGLNLNYWIATSLITPYTIWQTTNPLSDSNDWEVHPFNCVFINARTGSIHDDACRSSRHFICETA